MGWSSRRMGLLDPDGWCRIWSPCTSKGKRCFSINIPPHLVPMYENNEELMEVVSGDKIIGKPLILPLFMRWHGTFEHSHSQINLWMIQPWICSKFGIFSREIYHGIIFPIPHSTGTKGSQSIQVHKVVCLVLEFIHTHFKGGNIGWRGKVLLGK